MFPYILDRLTDLFGYEAYDKETENHIREYLTACYPGPLWVVYGDLHGQVYVDAEFKNESDATMFLLKWAR